MKEINNLDDYRHKLIDKILQANSYEQIKRFLLTAISSLKKYPLNGHLISRFIDKSINQLHGVCLLDTDVKLRLNARYAKSQLEMIKRSREEEKADHI